MKTRRNSVTGYLAAAILVHAQLAAFGELTTAAGSRRGAIVHETTGHVEECMRRSIVGRGAGAQGSGTWLEPGLYARMLTSPLSWPQNHRIDRTRCSAR
ncbi:hypothetical protein FA95DRAFT_1152354 [Auriscalpium vulgare]|uniref:Uncharacterized protein n=1 Tax=Auriscalpium vulgare TaxID=40419 RepID=A0ACB8RUN7_9AGAM|nr:hypothetical protein FA95DRAFT_1152354 [Auriscalpium vulgare]